ncbi:MAG: hypothetical protein HRT89_04075 [Lentisphaeria bacterium]|nr:hypothetical protein [Lentisphaeria bacterium]
MYLLIFACYSFSLGEIESFTYIDKDDNEVTYTFTVDSSTTVELLSGLILTVNRDGQLLLESFNTDAQISYTIIDSYGETISGTVNFIFNSGLIDTNDDSIINPTIYEQVSSVGSLTSHSNDYHHIENTPCS